MPDPGEGDRASSFSGPGELAGVPRGTTRCADEGTCGMKKRVSPDEELMTALYTEHYAVLLSFISRYVHDRHKAEDLVQETLLRAWKHIDHLDPEPGRTRSYLLTIARNVVTNAWRAEQRRPHLVADEDAVGSVSSADNVDQLVEGWLVAEALERLSPEHQAVVRA